MGLQFVDMVMWFQRGASLYCTSSIHTKSGGPTFLEVSLAHPQLHCVYDMRKNTTSMQVPTTLAVVVYFAVTIACQTQHVCYHSMKTNNDATGCVIRYRYSPRNVPAIENIVILYRGPINVCQHTR